MRLYNTLTRRLEELPPPPGPIRMYFCGPTVYQRAHIGNARPFVLGMWLRAWLRHRGYEAILVHNITDVNDKIYEAAPNESAALAERATAWYVEDTGDLGLGMPDAMPKATESIPSIVRFIEDLIEGEFAYAVEGDVYFRVARDPGYGRLSGQRPDQVEEQEPNPLKEDPRDFALWKANKPGEDTSWDAPWGRGRPGWHIECSAMAEDAFGPAFEIHGGGLDLVFPHHENELAQSNALGHEFARIWTQNGMLQFGGEKMSKSLGNDVSIRNVLDTWGREVVLLFFMTAHWRKPVDFTDDTLAQTKAQLEGFRNVFRSPSEPGGDWSAFEAALDDDFNTPEALALLHGWRDHELLRRGLELFGLGSLAEADEAPPEVVKLAEARRAARASGDFAEADRLRNEIADLGWEVRDTPGGFDLYRR
ncbi:MAG TPA: cysteine--tRNA ligase [Gaiellaceae bacterium]|nr:cysteine--tRNA ligase [Gaiellaceae bacterium]